MLFLCFTSKVKFLLTCCLFFAIVELTYAVNSGVRVLNVIYKTNKLERICTNASVAQKEYDQEMAGKISQRIGELKAAVSVEMLVQFQIGRCHPLKGNRKGEFAMDLVHPFRLVFEKNGNDIQLVRITAIEDYH